jgi:hypothetical protein
MTETEMKEEIEPKQVKKCEFCGDEFINLGSHLRHCDKRKDKQSKPTSTQEEPQKQYLNIQDIQTIESIGNMVAWFDDGKGNKIAKIPDFVGLLVNEDRNESIPTVLLLAMDGTFVPPFLMAGFIGMFPEDQVFPEKPAEKSEQQPEQMDIDPKRETGAEIELRAKDGVQEQSVSPPIPVEQPKKKGFLGGVFKKKKAEPEQPKEMSKETKDLLNQLTNAAK